MKSIGFTLIALFWFAPLIAGFADALLWFFGAPYRVVDWNADRCGFLIAWTMLAWMPALFMAKLFLED